MPRKMYLLVVAVVAFTFGSAVSAPAQDAMSSQLYGMGVHSYYSGNYNQASREFTSAINGGTKDPRPYYYRGLCELRMGRSAAAAADFQAGAQMEGSDANQSFPVSKSLERVQGSPRMTLEKYRMGARVATFERKEKQRQAIYERQREKDSVVLRQGGPPPTAAGAEQRAGAIPPPPGENPFGQPPATSPTDQAAGTAPAQPATAAQPEAADPFGGSPPPAKGAPPATGDAPPPGGGTPTPPPATDDPFGGTTPPPGTKPPAGGDDPFGPPPGK